MLVDLGRVVYDYVSETPGWSLLLQTVGVFTAYLGAELNSRLKVSSFYVWGLSNIALGALHIASGLWLMLVLDILFFKINCQAISKWQRAKLQGAQSSDGIGKA